MSLDSNLKTAITRLRSNDLGSEEEVKIAVILPILQALDWDPRFGSVKPEYSVGQDRVDYALMRHGRPQVFIEAKRRGALNVRAEEQLFGYAVNQGIPLLVLTDGFHWDFYLSMAEGLPEERRFFRLELFHEDEISEYKKSLETYLREQRVASGEARRSAEACLERNRERARAREAIPFAWSSLLTEPDELLRDLLAEKVQHTTGAKPDPDDVVEFLKSLPTVPARPGRQRLSTKAKPQELADETKTSAYGSGAESRRGTRGDVPAPPLQTEAQPEERLQDIVRDLMLTILEKFPGTLDEETISHLVITRNPLGLRISGHTLLRKVSEGRTIGGHNRYWKRAYARQWYICSQWWADHHHHNAKMLTNWINQLIAADNNFETRNILVNISKRLDSYAQDTLQ